MSNRNLLNTPASSATPAIFTNLLWGIRLKSLLQFSSGIHLAATGRDSPAIAPVSISTDPRLFLR